MVASIGAVAAPAQGASYYERDGYYAKDDPAHKEASAWAGRGAADLGLSGPVDPDTFRAVLEGEVPDGSGRRLGRRGKDGGIHHRPGRDLTFSAPKSVSLLALVGGDARIVQAHDRAVARTLSWVERNVAETRMSDPGTGGIVRAGDQKTVVATFRHDASRNMDPLLHTHSVIANMVRGADGKWRAMSNEKLYAQKMLIGAAYRSELARDLGRLGYRTEKTHADGRFEIAGVPRNVIEAFSTRRAEIEAAVAERGAGATAGNQRLAQRAALMTRAHKREVDKTALRATSGRSKPQTWASTRKPSPPKPCRGAPYPGTQDGARTRLPDPPAKPWNGPWRISPSARRSSPARVSSQARSPGPRAPYRWRRPNAKWRGWRRREPCTLRTCPERRTYSPRTGPLPQSARRSPCSRPAGDGVLPRCAPAPWTRRLRKGPLTGGQRDAVKLILSEHDRTVGVQGYAGTGKTTMLNRARALLEKRGYEVKGLAPSASAARTLETEAGIASETLQRFLARNSGLAQGRLTKKGQKQMRAAYRKTALVVDEGSLASTREVRELLKIADVLRLPRVVLVGDAKQLDAVDAGKPFAQLQGAGMKTAVMKEIMRQRDPELKAAVEASLAGDVKRAFEKLGSNVAEVRPDNLAGAAAARWLGLSPEARAKAGLMAPSHAIREQINAIVRERLIRDGVVHGPAMKSERLVSRGYTHAEKSLAANYAPGDVVAFHRPYKRLGVEKGDELRVSGVDHADGAVRLESKDGRSVLWAPGKSRGAKRRGRGLPGRADGVAPGRPGPLDPQR